MLTLLSRWKVDPKTPIQSVDALRNHLVQAAGIELSTVPLYLYAAYSIKGKGYSQWSTGTSAFDTIRSVVIEEMLHLCLARNLLTAVGGDVAFYDEAFVFKYPSPMPHRQPELIFRLEPATIDVVRDIFMALELPEHPPSLGRAEGDGIDEYHTLGEFYAAIAAGFEYLDAHQHDELWDPGSVDRQYSRAYWGGGKPLVVSDLETAQQAIRTIVEQGEGAKPGATVVPIDPNKPADPKFPYKVLTELSHYAKFRDIVRGIDEIGELWPVPRDPQPPDFDFKGPDGREVPAAALARLFDAAYCYVLCLIDALYATPMAVKDGDWTKSRRYGLERSFLAAMGGMLYPIADLLVRTPVTGTTNAAPGFRFYTFPDGPTKKDHLIALCDGLLGHFPSLGGDDGVRQLMGALPPV